MRLAVGDQVVVQQVDRRRAAVGVDAAAERAPPGVADDVGGPRRRRASVPVTSRSWAARSRRTCSGPGLPAGSASHGFTTGGTGRSADSGSCHAHRGRSRRVSTSRSGCGQPDRRVSARRRAASSVVGHGQLPGPHDGDQDDDRERQRRTTTTTPMATASLPSRPTTGETTAPTPNWTAPSSAAAVPAASPCRERASAGALGSASPQAKSTDPERDDHGGQPAGAGAGEDTSAAPATAPGHRAGDQQLLRATSGGAAAG